MPSGRDSPIFISVQIASRGERMRRNTYLSEKHSTKSEVNTSSRQLEGSQVSWLLSTYLDHALIQLCTCGVPEKRKVASADGGKALVDRILWDLF